MHFRTLLACGLLLAAMVGTVMAQSAGTAPSSALAFPKASPLLTYATAELLGGKSTDFDFGRPYQVFETTDTAIGIDVDGARLYVKRAHVMLAPEARFVATQDSFKYAERAHIRFWSSNLALSQFLVGASTGDNGAAFEEYLETAPGFSVHLPVVASDTVEVLTGERQASIANVLVPISRQSYERYEGILEGADIALQIALLADTSGSTQGFLEPAVAELAEAIARDPVLRGRVKTVELSTFGQTKRSAHRVGSVRLERLSQHTFFAKGARPPSEDAEPLVPALKLATSPLAKASGTATALLVLSGADVALSDTERGVTTEIIDIGSLENMLSIFVQVTPEPGSALEEASRMTRGSGRFVPFANGGMAGRVVALLNDYIKTMSSSEMEPVIFAPAADLAHAEGMISLLPMDLVPESHLPPPPPFAMNADWYTASLWLAVDGLVLKYDEEWAPRETSAPPVDPEPGKSPVRNGVGGEAVVAKAEPDTSIRSTPKPGTGRAFGATARGGL